METSARGGLTVGVFFVLALLSDDIDRESLRVSFCALFGISTELLGTYGFLCSSREALCLTPVASGVDIVVFVNVVVVI
jgi:hypothetical protein